MQPEASVEIEQAIRAAGPGEGELAAGAPIGRVAMGRHGGQTVDPTPQDHHHQALFARQARQAQARPERRGRRHPAREAVQYPASAEHGHLL